MKKKLLLFAMALFAFTGNMMAVDNLTLSNVEIMQGKTAILEIGTDFTSDIKQGFQLEFTLPEGLEVINVEVNPELKAQEQYKDLFVSFQTTNGVTKILSAAVAAATLPTGKYLLATATIKCDASVATKTYPVNTSKIELVDKDNNKLNPETSFNIQVIPYAARILDEKDTNVPAASTAAEDVIINRALKANTWATICLPFALNADQISEVFGDATIADFLDHDINEDETQITLNFESVTEMEANHPYLIKVSNALKEIKLIDVMVDPNEEKAVVTYDNGKPGNRLVIYSKFIGVLHATKVPDKNIYLNGNKFYVSANDAAINAYRGYFWIGDFEDLYQAGANINIMVDGDATAIEGITINGRNYNTGDVYTVSGMYMGRAENVMNTLPAGIYIVNNKKVIIK